MAFGFKSADTADIQVTDDEGRTSSVSGASDDRSAGALDAVGNGRINSSPDDLALSSGDDGTMYQDAAPTSSKNLTSQVSDVMGQACDSLGIDRKNGQMLMNMMGMSSAMQMIDMFGQVLNKLQENGAHGEGGELGNPQANLAPPTVGLDQPDRGIQVTQ